MLPHHLHASALLIEQSQAQAQAHMQDDSHMYHEIDAPDASTSAITSSHAEGSSTPVAYGQSSRAGLLGDSAQPSDPLFRASSETSRHFGDWDFQTSFTATQTQLTPSPSEIDPLDLNGSSRGGSTRSGK